ncbi:MAG: M23 family metallopeptidase [Tannerella sp.]|nr:M23 family metallopeptidase [Tannerella sp.]
MKKLFIYTFLLLAGTVVAQTKAQNPANPLDFDMSLSGGFCELRANHFHAGVDVRTKGVEGHSVHAVAKGYVSRVTVSPFGYGLAVYITHPGDSIISVYGHLQRFNSHIAAIVKEKQYKNESYTVDIKFDPGAIPVSQGEVIAFSGNSGSSAAPHLHLEIRDMKNGDYLDPLVYFKKYIKDTRKPFVRELVIYPVEGKGVVNGSSKKQIIKVETDKNENPVVDAAIEAYGAIGLGIRAIDRMDGTTFSYGIKDILQTVDSVETYRSYADRFAYEESRYLNSYTDYEEYSRRNVFYIKTFVEPGNRAGFIASRNSGIINITEEREYNVTVALSDIYKNVSKVNLKIKGRKQDIAPPDTAGNKLMRWYDYNSFSTKGIRLTVPRNSLYSNLYMAYSAIADNKYYSPIHVLHNSPVPLHSSAQLSISVSEQLTPPNTKQLGIVRINSRNGNAVWIGGSYRDGWLDSEIQELGKYTVSRDVDPPVITPVNPDKWINGRQITVRIKDDLSGVYTYRGEIDGKYALFEYDAKKALITYKFDDKRLRPGSHRLRITVTDQCGNRSRYEYAFSL